MKKNCQKLFLPTTFDLKNIPPKIWFDYIFMGEQTNLGRGRGGHVRKLEDPLPLPPQKIGSTLLESSFIC